MYYFICTHLLNIFVSFILFVFNVFTNFYKCFKLIEIGWRAIFSPADHPVSQYEFDVLIGADGKRNTLEGILCTKLKFRK